MAFSSHILIYALPPPTGHVCTGMRLPMHDSLMPEKFEQRGQTITAHIQGQAIFSHGAMTEDRRAADHPNAPEISPGFFGAPCRRHSPKARFIPRQRTHDAKMHTATAWRWFSRKSGMPLRVECTGMCSLPPAPRKRVTTHHPPTLRPTVLASTF